MGFSTTAQAKKQVISVDSVDDFPTSGVDSTVYIDKSTSIAYAWDTTDTKYVQLSKVYTDSSISDFPATGEDGTIYLSYNDAAVYYWNGQYTQLSKVLTYSAQNDFPSPGHTGVVYIDLSDDKAYFWSANSNSYVPASSSVDFGIHRGEVLTADQTMDQTFLTNQIGMTSTPQQPYYFDLSNNLFTNCNIAPNNTNNSSIIIGVGGSTNTKYLLISQDNGDTWTMNTKPTDQVVGNFQFITGNTIVCASRVITGTVGTTTNGSVYKSTDLGVTWTKQDGNMTSVTWPYFVSSFDGTKYVAVNNNNQWCVSTDGGTTWTVKYSPANTTCSSLCMSADGSKIFSTCYTATTPYTYSIVASTDGGTTWTTVFSNNTTNSYQWAFTNLTCSQDGTKVVASGATVGIFVSANSGTTWSQTSANGTAWISPNGGAILATSSMYSDESLQISKDSGATWSNMDIVGIHTWADMTFASENDFIVSRNMGNGDTIYYSNNAGASWVASAPSIELNFTDVSDTDVNGTVFACNSDGIFTSTDSGTTWEQIVYDTTYQWVSVALCSGNNTVYALDSSTSKIYQMTLTGNNFTVVANSPTDNNWGKIRSSGNLIAAIGGTNIYYTSDGWTTIGTYSTSGTMYSDICADSKPDNGDFWYAVAKSEDMLVYSSQSNTVTTLNQMGSSITKYGDKIAVINNGVSVSLDEGTTWNNTAFSVYTGYFNSILYSHDGSKLFLTNGNMYGGTPTLLCSVDDGETFLDVAYFDNRITSLCNSISKEPSDSVSNIGSNNILLVNSNSVYTCADTHIQSGAFYNTKPNEMLNLGDVGSFISYTGLKIYAGDIVNGSDISMVTLYDNSGSAFTGSWKALGTSTDGLEAVLYVRIV